MKKLLLMIVVFLACMFSPPLSSVDHDSVISQDIIQEAEARSGCCSWHGGVCGCDESSDRIIC